MGPFWRKTLHGSQNLIRLGSMKCSPEVVTSNETLQAGAHGRTSEVLAKLNGLVYGTITVPKVGRLRVTKVDAEAFGGAVGGQCREEPIIEIGSRTHKPIARAKLMTPSSVRTSGELRPEMTTWDARATR